MHRSRDGNALKVYFTGLRYINEWTIMVLLFNNLISTHYETGAAVDAIIVSYYYCYLYTLLRFRNVPVVIGMISLKFQKNIYSLLSI